MLKHHIYWRGTFMDFYRSDEHYCDGTTNAIFVVWSFVDGWPESVEYGHVCEEPGGGEFNQLMIYRYGQPMGWRNLYAKLADMTNDADIVGYIENLNCSPAELQKIILRGPVDLSNYVPSIQLVRRIKRIPECRAFANSRSGGCIKISISRGDYKDIWRWVCLDFLNFRKK